MQFIRHLLISWEITAAKEAEHCADDWNTFVSNPVKTIKPFKGVKWHTVQTKFIINRFKQDNREEWNTCASEQNYGYDLRETLWASLGLSLKQTSQFESDIKPAFQTAGRMIRNWYEKHRCEEYSIMCHCSDACKVLHTTEYPSLKIYFAVLEECGSPQGSIKRKLWERSLTVRGEACWHLF